MCRLIETVKIESGEPANISYHNSRLNKARRELFGCTGDIDLRDAISLKSEHRSGIHKCRILYDAGIHAVEITPYRQKIVESLKIIQCDTIDYSYKFEDREELNALLRQRAGCDDILIVKNGLITDTSFSNIAFYDGKRWVTPAIPLLKGTKRAQLLHDGYIHEEEIKTLGLKRFTGVCLINAMLEFHAVHIAVDCIR